jgi:hypothetical protein
MMVAPAAGLSRSLAPFPSLRSVTAPAVRRDALPKSSEEGFWDPLLCSGGERRLEPGWVARVPV